MKRTQLAKLLTFLPLAMTLIWLQFLPDRVPIRYSFSGAIDAWGSKWTYLILPGVVLAMGIAIGLGLMSVFLGNLMPRSRRNSTFGLRCAWSQYSDETWRRTNWFGGIAMMVSGILTVLGAVLTPETWAIGIALAMISLALIVSLCYARRVYRKEKAKG